MKPNNNGNPYGLWLAEGAECEAILLNTAANDGDANIPDCGDVIPGQVSPSGQPAETPYHHNLRRTEDHA